MTEKGFLVLFRLLILLTMIPLVELVLLLRLADRITWLWTIALVMVTGVLGAYLARREGLRTLNRFMADVSEGTPPAGAVVDGMLILVAGAFLVTPGLLTDVCGFGLLVPRIRGWVRRKLAHVVEVRIGRHSYPTGPSPFVDVVATEARDAEPQSPSKRLSQSDGQ